MFRSQMVQILKGLATADMMKSINMAFMARTREAMRQKMAPTDWKSSVRVVEQGLASMKLDLPQGLDSEDPELFDLMVESMATMLVNVLKALGDGGFSHPDEMYLEIARQATIQYE